MLEIIYDQERALLIPVRVTVALLFLIYGWKIKKKQDYIVNKLFFAAFTLWALYLISTSFSRVFAADSLTAYNIANVFWIVEITLLWLYTYVIFIIIRIILHGEQFITKNKKRLVIEFTILIVLAIYAAIFARVQIFDANNLLVPTSKIPYEDPHIVKESFNQGIGAVIIAYIVNITSLVLLSKVHSKVEDVETKEKMKFMLIGISMIPLGLFYYFLRTLGLFPYTFWYSIVGQVIFLIAPFAVWKSQR